ncbi:hypothetical protein BGW36DRAFT_424460 [Talaromyces proteolyticus]|uniref:Uncharacterized protein n=1 Tax=Talaromyces proteolyticus TaxID=1131652 RepID=A0AAD4KX88_9EURO|nr:uncharacterized protein BGW36DRAFT_424460 [Talaromyces proteolyticus]KAH8702174.1 hypothetical protein BGW36DRAFT_424460 [Talaromyces proteolyticus]
MSESVTSKLPKKTDYQYDNYNALIRKIHEERLKRLELAEESSVTWTTIRYSKKSDREKLEGLSDVLKNFKRTLTTYNMQVQNVKYQVNASVDGNEVLLKRRMLQNIDDYGKSFDKLFRVYSGMELEKAIDAFIGGDRYAISFLTTAEVRRVLDSIKEEKPKLLQP